MGTDVIHLVRPGREVAKEIAERPHGMLLGINRLRDLADLLGDLGIASQSVYKLGVRCSKKSFDNGPISWLRPGSAGLGTRVVGQQRLKVDTAKIGTSIDNQRLRDAPIAP